MIIQTSYKCLAMYNMQLVELYLIDINKQIDTSAGKRHTGYFKGFFFLKKNNIMLAV